MLKKSAFFDFLNRRETDFESFLANTREDHDYIDWNGYLLAMDYGDAEAEYRAIRDSCALFDVSPLRKCVISGPQAGEFLDRLCTRPVSSSADMRGIYVVFCNEDGSLKDDAILHKLADDDYLLLPSDVDHIPYFKSLCSRWEMSDVAFCDCTSERTAFALQGPASAHILHLMGFTGIEQLRPFELGDFPMGAGVLRIARMGFTGDLGYECWLQPPQVSEVCALLAQARRDSGLDIPGYGLTALEACRLEGGFIVAGWDCATEVDPQPGFSRSPLELGLAWMVHFDGADFVGREALQQQRDHGHRWHQRSFMIAAEQGPEPGESLFIEQGSGDVKVGRINCLAWSGELQSMIGNCCLEQEHAALESAQTRIGDRKVKVQLLQPPLLKRDYARHTPAPLGITVE